MAERRYPVSGEVDVSNAPDLRTNLLVLINATNDDLVLDCAKLEFIDSTGVAVFMHASQLLEIQGRGLRLVNLHGMPLRAIQLLGVSEMLVETELA